MAKFNKSTKWTLLVMLAVAASISLFLPFLSSYYFQLRLCLRKKRKIYLPSRDWIFFPLQPMLNPLYWILSIFSFDGFCIFLGGMIRILFFIVFLWNSLYLVSINGITFKEANSETLGGIIIIFCTPIIFYYIEKLLLNILFGGSILSKYGKILIEKSDGKPINPSWSSWKSDYSGVLFIISLLLYGYSANVIAMQKKL
jgi:hypothetical protein